MLGNPFCDTVIVPGTMELGTVRTICVSLQLLKVLAPCVSPGAENVTWPTPRVAPNPDPVSVIVVPGLIAAGEMLVKVGAMVVYAMPLLGTPFCDTVIVPGTIELGAVRTICVSLQLLKVLAPCVSPGAENVTWPTPRVAPNPDPVNVTVVPGLIAAGDIPVNVGAMVVYATPLLVAPFCVIVIVPDTIKLGTVKTICVSLQLIKALAPCVSPGAEKVTEPTLWPGPKPEPVSVMVMPGSMAVGEMLVNVGAMVV